MSCDNINFNINRVIDTPSAPIRTAERCACGNIIIARTRCCNIAQNTSIAYVLRRTYLHANDGIKSRMQSLLCKCENSSSDVFVPPCWLDGQLNYEIYHIVSAVYRADNAIAAQCVGDTSMVQQCNKLLFGSHVGSITLCITLTELAKCETTFVCRLANNRNKFPACWRCAEGNQMITPPNTNVAFVAID